MQGGQERGRVGSQENQGSLESRENLFLIHTQVKVAKEKEGKVKEKADHLNQSLQSCSQQQHLQHQPPGLVIVILMLSRQQC